MSIAFVDNPITSPHFHLGSSAAPWGDTIGISSSSLLLNGKPWLPVMGEMQYSRYPAAEWPDELLKMKAGGIDIVATYVFWIHHEEVEGEFDWTGRRDLGAFVRHCSKFGLLCVIRCGPWCHGEVRNGGFPDWLLKTGATLRSDDPAYLHLVRRLYREISKGVEGLLWKDGGPVIGMQLENEYDGPAEHILTLKRIAREEGLDVPLYTRTGWPAPSTPMPFGETIPLYGGYAEGFWDRTLEQMPGGYWRGFCFEERRTDSAIAADRFGERDEADDATAVRSPYATCELGGGMQVSYHRRIFTAPEDAEALAIAKLGSGSNLPGYYVYHGGANPKGRLSTMQESQATGYPNDVTVKSYDFQAPLGEFGQVRKHYHLLKRLHLFLHDFGAQLAGMQPSFPSAPASRDDVETLCWSARSNGRSAFVFVNNYRRLQTMPVKRGVQLPVALSDRRINAPSAPIDLPADSCFFWPVNLDLDGVTLVYSTAQPVCRIADGDCVYYVFAQIPGIASEFVFDSEGWRFDTANGAMRRGDGDQVSIVAPECGPNAAVILRACDGKIRKIILLDKETSLTCWKGEFAGRERLLLTSANLVIHDDDLRLITPPNSDIEVAMLPAATKIMLHERALEAQAYGDFARYVVTAPVRDALPVKAVQIREGGVARPIPIGPAGVAQAPEDREFESAAVWRLIFPENVDSSRDLLLRITYFGDVARIYLGDELIADNFYCGEVFDLGLKRFAPAIYEQPLLLKVLPLALEAPISLRSDIKEMAAGRRERVACLSVEVIESVMTELRARVGR